MSQDEISAIHKAINKNKDQQDRQHWEQAREICFYSLVAMRGTKEFQKASDVFELPWDKKTAKKTKK
jgi:hypothetical protein